MAAILLLEDDPVLGDSLHDLLTSKGYATRWVTDGEEAADATYAEHFDLYLFDINVPQLGGFDLLSALREADDHTPAIFISALRDIGSLTRGFEAGADDYLKKPFDVKELLLRIRARLPHHHAIAYGALLYEPQGARLSRNGEVIDLGEIQKQIFTRLIQNVGQTLDKGVLLELLDHPSEQALRFHISKLKHKLGIDIVNVRGVGYRLEAL